MFIRVLWRMVGLALLVRAETQAAEGAASEPSLFSREGWAGGISVPAEVAEPYGRALDAAASGNWARAAELLAAVLKKSPDSTPVRLLYGAALVHEGRGKEGEAVIDKALGSTPGPEELAMVARLLEDSKPLPGTRSPARSYLQRAFERARSMNYDESDDAEKLSLIAMLALELGREVEFGRATATLVKNHPGVMMTHYYNAHRAAKEGDWVTAEDEIRRAGQLGLPREVVDQSLASGLHARASTWRFFYYSLYSGAAWALGLVALFLAGKVLSTATLRSAQIGDPNRAITPSQRILRSAYRVVINLAGLYYYVSLPFVALLAIWATLGAGYAVLLLPRIPVELLCMVAGFGFAMLAMIWALIRSLFARLRDDIPGRRLSEEEAPGLWDLASRVAERVGTRPIDDVYLMSGTALGVFEHGRWPERMGGRTRRVLALGLRAVDGFRLGPFRAVLAHEYGHFLHRDTAGGHVALRVNSTMRRFAEAMLRQGSTTWWNLGWHFLRLYHFLFRRITLGASRLQEIIADRVAARAYGKGAFEEGLRHVIRRDLEWRFEQALADQRGVDGPRGSGGDGRSDVGDSHQMPPYLRAEARHQIMSFLGQIWKAGTSEDDTHPSPAERIRLIQGLPEGDEEPTSEESADPSGTVADLLGTIQAELRRSEEKARSEAKHAYFKEALRQVDAYLADNAGAGDGLRHRAELFFQMGDYQRAIADYGQCVQLRSLIKPFCHYGRGIALSKLGKLEAAADDLREAMQLDPRFESEKGDGRAQLGEILFRAGLLEASIAEFDRAIELGPDRLGLYLQRGVAHAARGDHQAAEADFSRALEIDPECAEALAGRALTRHVTGRRAEAIPDVQAASRIEPAILREEPLLASILAENGPGPAR